jgi:cytochrome c-type protein NapC
MPRQITMVYNWLRAWVTRRWAITVLILGVFAGMAGLAVSASTLVYTSTEEFCAFSCHEMANNVSLEYRDSVHDRNRTGVRAMCPDCHVPHAPIPLYVAKMGAINDLWSHYVAHRADTKEKWEAQRPEMAVRVWTYMKGNDSRECRHCHNVAKMDPDKQTADAKKEHERGVKDKLTCVDCHFGIAHREPKGGIGPQDLDVRPSHAGSSLF